MNQGATSGGKMRALVYTAPNTLTFEKVQEPVPAPGEVVVGVEAVGICGSDMHAWHGHDERRPAPLVLGHEAAGCILAGPRTGERVTINPLVTCGHCRFCLGGRSNLCRERQILSMPPRNGAFAERLAIPEQNLVTVPGGLSITQAALAEPIAVAWHAVSNGVRALWRPLPAARCVVLGGGAIGLASSLVLAAGGAGELRIVEPNAARRRTLAVAAQTSVADATELPGGMADLVIDAVGAVATRKAASRLAAPGGVVVHVGLLPGSAGLDVRRLTLQEITLIGAYCYTHSDFVEAVAALASGRLGALNWVEERPLADGADAFADLDRGEVPAAKIVLRP